MSNYIARYGSQTLANVKVSNLFNYQFQSKKILYKKVKLINKRLNPFNIHVIPLRIRHNKALIFIYRRDVLSKLLENEEIKNFLRSINYENINVDDCIKELKKRLSRINNFPHELGIFLGYPFNDVISFIENKGLNYLVNGYWKVYHNPEEASEIFNLFDRVKDEIYNNFKNGMPLEYLIVKGEWEYVRFY